MKMREVRKRKRNKLTKMYENVKCPNCGELREVELINWERRKTDLCRKCYVSTKMTRHGLSNHKLHNVWRNMKDRCSNPNRNAYPDYGGRGISVCEIWKSDFKSFFDWAMENGYQEGLELDRINNNGNYEPENCRWITHAENMQNRVR
jgi:hypothetical protein